MSTHHTASGAIDHRADCPCRTSDPPQLCAQCYAYGLRILLAHGLGRELARIDREAASLAREQQGYLRRSRDWYWGG